VYEPGAKLSAPELTTIEAYEASVPFPLSAARAKSRQFCEEARIRAGLPEDFIRYVRDARSTQETQALPRDARRTSQ
jgi:predicted amidophosphoribosyltransferase